MNPIKWAIGHTLSLLVIPAQKRKDNPNRKAAREKLHHKDIYMERLSLPSSGGALIDGKLFYKDGSKRNKVLVFANGNGDGYERYVGVFYKFARLFSNSLVVSFNFRNVYESKGIPHSAQDWVDDTHAVLDHLKGLGFRNDQIVVVGHSMGAAISTMAVAQRFKKDKKENPQATSIRLINHRSFSNLMEQIMYSELNKTICSFINIPLYATLASLIGFASSSLGLVAATGSMIMASSALIGIGVGAVGLLHPSLTFHLLRGPLTLLCLLCFGKMDAQSAYESLPNDAKDFMVVRNDSRIKYESGLYYSIKHAHDKTIQHHATCIAKIENELEDSDDLGQSKRHALTVSLNNHYNELLNLKDCKLKHWARNDGHLAHNDRLVRLTTYHPLRANDFKHAKPEEYKDIGHIHGREVLENKIRRFFRHG